MVSWHSEPQMSIHATPKAWSLVVTDVTTPKAWSLVVTDEQRSQRCSVSSTSQAYYSSRKIVDGSVKCCSHCQYWLWNELHKDYGDTDSGTNYRKVKEGLTLGLITQSLKKDDSGTNYRKFNEGLILARITQILNKDWLWNDSGKNYTRITEILTLERITQRFRGDSGTNYT